MDVVRSKLSHRLFCWIASWFCTRCGQLPPHRILRRRGFIWGDRSLHIECELYFLFASAH
eukprot:scaffold64784_cov33-Tisochrysis_lutea.AAC.2